MIKKLDFVKEQKGLTEALSKIIYLKKLVGDSYSFIDIMFAEKGNKTAW